MYNTIVKRFLLTTLIICICVTLHAGCFGKPKTKHASLNIYRGDEIIATLNVEIADTSEKRQKGLMYRETLDDGYGMFFYYKQDHHGAFWMANTYIPLSIAFISSAGIIMEIRDMEPLDTTHIKPVHPYRHALEVPQGWFTRTGVQVGDKIIFS